MRELLYEITHTTTYDYVGSVSVSHHLLRLTPRHGGAQRVLAHELRIDPDPAVLHAHRDYFGNTTHFLSVERPHGRLSVTAHSRVALRPPFIPEPSETPAWEAVRARCRDDHSSGALEAHEFIYPSPCVPTGPEFAEFAGPSFPRGRPLLEAVLDLTRRIHAGFQFDPEATTVSTPVRQVLERRRGVCQDFAHLQIACLRSLSLPARYVSGYLETDPPPGQAKLRGTDASHAWVAFYCPGVGWLDTDPTNNCLPSLRHVTIGWGRDYGDVGPVRGVLMGGQGQALSVAVDVVAQGPVSPERAHAPRA
ncbi:MAG: Protein-glutamine gamma-glutamyltransferase [Verrucomicrobiota bacterium]|jgi:transglutaminase-like putative cysteine protease